MKTPLPNRFSRCPGKAASKRAFLLAAVLGALVLSAVASGLIDTGKSYHNARDVLHETRNAGKGPARLLATFVVDQGQPIMKPAATAE